MIARIWHNSEVSKRYVVTYQETTDLYGVKDLLEYRIICICETESDAIVIATHLEYYHE
jgi:hypothetical protein